jgi:hypothetical protein
MLPGQDAHGKAMEGLPLKLLASRDCKLLQFPMKILGRYPREGYS